MVFYETVTIWAAVAFYAITTVLVIYMTIFSKTRPLNIALWAALFGTLLQLTSAGIRWADSGHFPLKGHYEMAALKGLFIAIPGLYVAFRKKEWRLYALYAFPVALFSLGYALTNYEKGSALTPAYKSTWLVVHIAFANLAYGALAFAFASAVVYLIKEKRLAAGRPEGDLLARLPDLETLDDLTFRLVIFGFVTMALMIVGGAFWSRSLWGGYWSWDPVETWSLICWFTYGAFIHLRLIHNWKGRRLAWLAILGILIMMISFWGVGFFESEVHNFDI